MNDIHEMQEMLKTLEGISAIEDMEDFIDIADNDDLETYLSKAKDNNFDNEEIDFFGEVDYF